MSLLLFAEQKKHLKTKVNQLLRRASTPSSAPDGKRGNGLEKVSLPKLRPSRRCSPAHPMTFSFNTGRRREDERQQGRLVPPLVRGEEPPASGQGAASRRLDGGDVRPQLFDWCVSVRRGRFWTRARRKRREGRPNTSRSTAVDVHLGGCKFIPTIDFLGGWGLSPEEKEETASEVCAREGLQHQPGEGSRPQAAAWLCPPAAE